MTWNWSLLWHWNAWAVLVAGALDLLMGDPSWLPHPVRFIGNGAYKLEVLCRKLPVPARVQGILFTMTVLAVTGCVVAASLLAAAQVHPALLFTVQVLWLHFGIATRDLAHALQRIEKPLRKGDLPGARTQVGWIVSRDTANLDSAGVCRSGIESGAENAVDGIVAPWFWALLGGPLGLWLYKAASTLDSQVGYKTPRHLHFGWASARLDDVLNFVPARLAVLPFSLAALLSALWSASRAGMHALPARLLRAWRIAGRDRVLHASPNSGIGEAWMAGFLGVRLMGPNVYHGKLCEKPWLGAEFGDAQPNDLRFTSRWVLACGLLCWLGVYLWTVCG